MNFFSDVTARLASDTQLTACALVQPYLLMLIGREKSQIISRLRNCSENACMKDHKIVTAATV